MAKGTGYHMAAVLGSLKVAHLRGKTIVCPICGGPMKVGFMTEQFKCQSESEDMPGWLAEALRGQSYNPHAYYPQDGGITVLATAGNGVDLVPMRDRGRFGGWQWDGVPEGEIAFPDWFPVEVRDAYVTERFATWGEMLEELLSHPDVEIPDEDIESEHPMQLIAKAERQIETTEAAREKRARRDAQRQNDQAALDKALAEDGFFRGRKGKAKTPEGATVIWSTSHGDRDDPIQIIVGHHLTIDQFKALVAAAGDYSEVRVGGRFPVLYTPSPARWIGKKGCIAKTLSAALGIKFLKVVEKK